MSSGLSAEFPLAARAAAARVLPAAAGAGFPAKVASEARARMARLALVLADT